MSDRLQNEEWARSLIDSMDKRSGAVAGPREWQVEREWPSFSARFFLLSAGSDRVALKLGTNWSGDLAAYVAEETERVRDVLAGIPSGRVVMPGVLGVSSSPPALALDYIDGEPLFDVLADLGGPQRSAVLNLCGQAIGAYHSSEAVPADAASTSAARSELRTASRRAGVRAAVVEAVEPGLIRARGYRFSPNDFLLVDREVLVLLDPPHVQKYDYVHRDLGSFFMELHRSLLGERTPRGHDDLATLVQAQGDFLEGYGETGPGPLDTDEDRWVIDVFQIARITGVVQRRLTSFDPKGAARAVAWAWGIRRGLKGRFR